MPRCSQCGRALQVRGDAGIDRHYCPHQRLCGLEPCDVCDGVASAVVEQPVFTPERIEKLRYDLQAALVARGVKLKLPSVNADCDPDDLHAYQAALEHTAASKGSGAEAIAPTRKMRSYVMPVGYHRDGNIVRRDAPPQTTRQRCDEFYQRSDVEIRLYEVNADIPSGGMRELSVVLTQPGYVRRLICADPSLLAWCRVEHVRRGGDIVFGLDNQLSNSQRRGGILHDLVAFDLWDELIGPMRVNEPIFMRVHNTWAYDSEFHCVWEVMQFKR